ncbi:uncharacterized protein LOC111884430 [Lactuca sativa]|uniref:uncharacterized protein LOC111884430 n=1 Tax=Lactuca sativa TaxID=4236 RepID=UPI000CD9AB43|nr:uncharacterized protein LOC111884430 [Lactuca sativa]
MAQPNVTLISDLDILKDDSTIKVRVINLWNLFSFYNKDELFSIELILIDEQGTKIQENSVMTFMDLHLALSLLITCPFILLVHPENIAIDVIGLVVAIGEMGRDNDDMKKHRLNIQIQDANGLQLSVNLWGDFAYKMQGFLDNNSHNLRIIVILQFAKLSIWRDRPTINTYFSVSKLFISTDIDEINLGFNIAFYPREINALIGLKLAFKISINHFNFSKRNDQYSICRVSDDEKLIEELENKFTVSQVGTSQSFDIGEADFESQDNRILKVI